MAIDTEKETTSVPSTDSGPVEKGSPSAETSYDDETDDIDYKLFDDTLTHASSKTESSPVAEVAKPVTPSVPPAQVVEQKQTTPPQGKKDVTVEETKQTETKEVKEEKKPATAEADNTDPFAQLDQAIQAQRSEVIKAVASQSYQLTQEELDAVATEPEKVLPVLMAKVHVNTVQGVMRHIATQLPAVLHGMLAAKEENSKREADFFKAWPMLDKTKHGESILKVGRVYKQLNPNATLDDFIKQVGAQVMVLHNLHLQQNNNPQQQVAKQPVAVQPAFKPAGVAAGGVPGAVQTQKNIWEEFAEVMKE